MPEHHRCKYRYNTLLNWRVGQKVKRGVLFKVLHADPSTCQHFDGSLDTDLNLLQIYSLNKQRRWEIQENLNQKILEFLQGLNQNLDLIVFQRTSVHTRIDSPCFPYYTISLQSSKIKKQYEISKDGMYQEQIFGGVGRIYGSNTKKVQDTPMEVVTYHIVQEPRNWKKVYTKDFYRCRWDRHGDF
ncbi:hypothetical protein CRE_15643 [Caenorhabditis remanei]|uniref:Uncharacterized protein n=1 Tax=Caenorhabditis remanei TaxID=31234 RepID=E3N840_CAERE|nr:hypothetical protein CRE_15643 [Caenorhabditis remanei]